MCLNEPKKRKRGIRGNKKLAKGRNHKSNEIRKVSVQEKRKRSNEKGIKTSIREMDKKKGIQ
jgi:hypothetical protein